MEVLLRELGNGIDGIPQYHDTTYSGRNLSVGSAIDCRIRLRGNGIAAIHAVFKAAGRAIQITCQRGVQITVNGHSCVSATLRAGDIVEIGGHVLALVDPPFGFDLAVEIRRNPEIESEDFEGAFRTDLTQTWLSKRPAAWVLLLLVLVLGFGIPLGTLYLRGAKEMRKLPNWVPTDQLWLTGPLVAAHRQAIGNHCEACHQNPFVRIRDSACRECHSPIRDHSTREILAKTKLGPPPRCATCHLEHNEDASFIIQNDDGFCTNCHAESTTKFPALKVDRISGFGPGRHAPFLAYLLKPNVQRLNTGLDIAWRVSIEPLDTAREESNLKFSHKQHLDGTRVKRLTDSRPLGCVDCHKLSAKGVHFEPITMPGRCAVCHRLTFDESARDRELPHGDPKGAIRTLQEFYIRKFVDPVGAGVLPPMRPARRAPGQADMAPVNTAQTCVGPPLECAERTVDEQAAVQFTRRGCIGCHVVIDSNSANILDRYQVYPVRLNQSYFPQGTFPHSAHLIQKDLVGDDACLSCHAAKKSTKSNDVLVPKIDKCFECHGDRKTGNRVPLTCLSCHQYHPPSVIAAKTIFTASTGSSGKP